jgi:hypothetical protein
MATPFTGIASGTHTIYVLIRQRGEVSTTGNVANQLTPITGFNLNTTAVSCNGGTDGTTATLTTPALESMITGVYVHAKWNNSRRASGEQTVSKFSII